MITHDVGIYVSIFLFLLLMIFNSLYIFKKFDLVFVFVNVHLASIAMFFTYQSGLLNYMQWWELGLLLSYIAGFILGFFMHCLLSPGAGEGVKVPRSARKIFILNLGGFCFFSAAFFYELAMSHWVPPLLAEDKLTAYYNFPQTFVHYLVVCGIAVSAVFVFIAERYSYRRLTCYLLVLFIAICQMATLARAVLMTQLFMAAFVFIRERHIVFRWRKLILGAGFALVIITVFGTMRTSTDANALLEIGLLDGWPTWSIPFAWIYLYFTTPLENFRGFLGYYDQGYGFGLHTFIKPFFNLLQSKDYYYSLFELQPPSAGGFNTYGYYLETFMDYGCFGFIYTMFLGYVSRALVVSRSLVFYLFSSYWVYAIFTSSVNMYFNEFFTLVYLGYFALIAFFSNLTLSRSTGLR
ncbi:O-antigen polymerase [Pseudomonas sp. BR20]|uniref:O-antigen polymerase n=1 Tax=Pseudomonas sp. BR20 TaxID=3137452 RepID=UPI003D6F99E9